MFWVLIFLIKLKHTCPTFVKERTNSKHALCVMRSHNSKTHESNMQFYQHNEHSIKSD